MTTRTFRQSFAKPPPAPGTLEQRVAKLERINAALMQRVEKSTDQQANAYSLFQTAIGLESQIRLRTEELNSALARLERTNVALMAARDAAERANRFKTHFFTAVGHDLLQPLHAARLSLSALADMEKEPEHHRLTDQIDHALSSVEDLLKTILDISRLEAGAMRPSLRALSLSELFDTLAVDLEPMARAKGLGLSFRDAGLSVISDPLMLKRILQNLLANAVRYTQKGRVMLAARKRVADNEVRIEVWDLGPGIAPEEREAIFEAFQRGSASLHAAGHGFGLGLAIVQHMAEALQHGIALCSRLGHGTRFCVTVPMADAADLAVPVPQAVAASQAYGMAAARVVVIDNDPAVLAAMRVLLDSWNCNARFARDLQELQAIAGDGDFRPDVILADYHLEHGASGLTGITRLRAAWDQDLPAVVVTADHGPEIAEQARLCDCEILRKPVRPAELRALMLHLLS